MYSVFIQIIHGIYLQYNTWLFTLYNIIQDSKFIVYSYNHKFPRVNPLDTSSLNTNITEDFQAIIININIAIN